MTVSPPASTEAPPSDRFDPGSEGRKKRFPVWLCALAQAIWPGAGMMLAGHRAMGLVTLVLWPATIITTHMRIVESGGQTAIRTGIWVGLLALIWANQMLLVLRMARAEPGETMIARRLAGQGPGPIAWLATRNWLLAAGLLFLIDRMALDSEVDFAEFFKPENIRALQRIAGGLIHPDFSILGMVIGKYAWVTLEMAVIGTLLGALVSAPLSCLGARNLVGRSPATAPIYYVTRFLLSVVRSIPTLIWGLMALSFGLGHFPGVIALGIFSFGLTAKLFSEAIEAIDWGPVEAVTAAGANPLHTLLFGVLPQVLPYFTSHLLYCLEVNVHSSVVLGLIGAGGLGLIVNEYISTFHWDQASTVLIVTIVMTLSIDYGSAYIRSRVV